MIFPPRPTQAIAPGMIPFYEERGYVGQLKMNGTCLVIPVANDKCRFFNRHGSLVNWTPPSDIVEYFQKFDDSIFIGELLHHKHPSVKNTVYLFDIIQFAGTSLVGMALAERLQLLHNMPADNPKIILAETLRENFSEIFGSLTKPTEEGMVLKDPKSKLEPCQRATANTTWQVKCRKPTKNYSF